MNIAPVNLLLPSPLTRSYRGGCSISYDNNCNETIYVNNSRRVGGICYNCRSKVYSQWLLKRCIRSRQKRIARKIQMKTSFLVMFRCMPVNTGGIGSGIAQTVNKFL